MNNTIIAVAVVTVVCGAIGYYYRATPGAAVIYCTIAVLLGFGIYFVYEGVTGDRTRSGNLASTPVDSSSTVVVPGEKAPPQSGPQGGNYGIQWWMFIQDWDYKFGENKPVIRRGSDNVYNPYVYLSPTENTLCVEVAVFPNDGSGLGGSGHATEDKFTCKVPNVPLQKWFAVGVSVSGRNVDIYLDGLLVRSCMLPGVPKTPTGSLEIMPGGGFSGSCIDVYHYSRALVPADAQKFAAAGTNGTQYNALPSKSLFGYTVKLGVVDNSGKEVKNFTF
jgi:hypothetical protein